MAPDDQDSLESEKISLLHDRILSVRGLGGRQPRSGLISGEDARTRLIDAVQESDHHSAPLSQCSLPAPQPRSQSRTQCQRPDGRRHDRPRRRQVSNTKAQRLKPAASTAPPAPPPPPPPASADMTAHDPSQAAPALLKRTTLHAFPVPAELDGDTQPMPSQFYKNYTSSYQPTRPDRRSSHGESQPDDDADDADATTDQDAQINLVEHWEAAGYHDVSSDDESDAAAPDQDETQYFLSSVNRPAFPKTPATAGHKRTRRGDIISTSSTKTPGSGLSAFGFGTAAPLSATQLFQATQAPSSPVPDFPRSDPLLTRPSPHIRHSSPVLASGGFESPLKHLVSPSRSVNALEPAKRPRRQGRGQRHHRGGVQEEERGAEDDDGGNEEEPDDYTDHDMFDLEHHLHPSPGTHSADEYDEFAQDIRPSQRALPSSARRGAPVDEVDVASQKSTPSRPPSRRVPGQGPRVSPPDSQHPPSRAPPAGQNDETTAFAVADSQPTRPETQPPPSLVEPSSMSSIVPGSYPLVSSQTPAALEALRRDAHDSSSIPLPPPLTSQAPARAQQRLPSSPPPLPAASEEAGEEVPKRVDPVASGRVSGTDGHSASLSSPLPGTRTTRHRSKEPKAISLQQSSAVPETDPVDNEDRPNQTRPSNPSPSIPLPKAGVGLAQSSQNAPSAADADVVKSVRPPSRSSKHRASQLQTQASGRAADSPRKAAGILNFADIAADPTPPDALKDIDMNIDLLSHDDKNFLEVMSSPPQPAPKRMRLYGKKGKIMDKLRKSVDDAKSPETLQPPPSKSLPAEGERSDRDSEEQMDDPENQPAPSRAPDERLPDSTSYSPPYDDFNRAGPDPAAYQIRPPGRPKDQHGNQAAGSARELLLARRKSETRGAEANSARGRLVRPKRRDSNSPIRTPNRNRLAPVEAPRSKLSHVEPVSNASDGIDAPAVSTMEPQQADEDNTAQVEPQPSEVNVTHDVAMTDAGSEQNKDHDEQHDGSAHSTAQITHPNRVLALFKGTGQAYYPATCLGASTLDGQKLRVRFDDGTITQLDSTFVRRLDLRSGDQVKVDLPGLRKVYTVREFRDRAEEVGPDTYPKTDVHGFETIELVPKERDSTAGPMVVPDSLLRAPVTSVYLTQTMWKRFDDRRYVPTTTTSAGSSSRVHTPVPQLTTPATPSSRSRRLTTLSNLSRPDFASPLPAGRGIFANMAFAVSYSSDDSSVRAEKDRVLALIQANGGLVLEKGFDELFEVQDLSESSEAATPQPRSRTSPARKVNDDDADLLTLAPRAKDLGFVALIADKHSRRAKYVQALALSLPCLAGRWVRDSVSAGHALPWPKYLLPAGESSFLSGAVRSRTLTSYCIATAKLETTVRQRTRLLDEGKVLLVAQAGKARWEARKPYAFLTFALGAKGVRRVVGLEAAKSVLDAESGWKWVYVEGKVEDAKKALFGSTEGGGVKRKRVVDIRESRGGQGKDGVRVVGDEFVVQSLILGDLVD